MENAELMKQTPKICVLGVGGGGVNTVIRIDANGIEQVKLYAINTDAQQLMDSNVPNKIQIGKNLTKGLGSGGDPRVAEEAALESYDELKNIIKDYNLVFVATGLGGGTGSGAAPIIAGIAKQMGILTLGYATLPFRFEGKKRIEIANIALEKLRNNCDALIELPNDILLDEFGRDNKNASLDSAFRISDMTLFQGVYGLSETIIYTGVINIDFADMKRIFKDSGTAYIGIGIGSDDNAHIKAVRNALKPTLIETNIRDAANVLLVIQANTKYFSMPQLEEVMEEVRLIAGDVPDIKPGLYNNQSFDQTKVTVTIIAAGFGYGEAPKPKRKEELPKEDKVEEQPVKEENTVKKSFIFRRK